MDLLRAISYYLKRDDKRLLSRMLTEQSSIAVRFKNLSFRCRPFSVVSPSEAATYDPPLTSAVGGSGGGLAEESVS